MRKEKESKAENSSKKVFDLTTRELRSEIRNLTLQVNQRIESYRKAVEEGSMNESKVVEKSINVVKESTSMRKVTGFLEEEYVVPSGYKGGEIGLGLSYKTKPELQKQLTALQRFMKNDINTPEGQQEWKQKTQQQYKAFKERYGDVSEEEYEEFFDTIKIIKNYLSDFGYEDYGGSLARAYVKAKSQGKRKFIRYIQEATKDVSGGKVTDVLDSVVAKLQKANEYN